MAGIERTPRDLRLAGPPARSTARRVRRRRCEDVGGEVGQQPRQAQPDPPRDGLEEAVAAGVVVVGEQAPSLGGESGSSAQPDRSRESRPSGSDCSAAWKASLVRCQRYGVMRNPLRAGRAARHERCASPPRWSPPRRRGHRPLRAPTARRRTAARPPGPAARRAS